MNPAHMEETAECWALWATPRKLLLLTLNFKWSQIHVLKLKHVLYCMHNMGPQCSANMSVLHLVFMSVHGDGLRSNVAAVSCVMMWWCVAMWPVPCPETAWFSSFFFFFFLILKGTIPCFIQRLPSKNTNTLVTPWIVLILCKYISVRNRINN